MSSRLEARVRELEGRDLLITSAPSEIPDRSLTRPSGMTQLGWLNQKAEPDGPVEIRR